MQTCRNQRKPQTQTKSFLQLGAGYWLYALLIFSTPPVLSAAVFQIPAGDVPGLIAAINTANANGEENTIILAPGTYTVAGFEPTGAFEKNPLPVVTSTLTLRGAGAEVTSIIAFTGRIAFPITCLSVAAAGTLILDGLTILGGFAPSGAGVTNEGSVTVMRTTIAQSRGGGGVFNSGTMTITESTIADNGADSQGGGGISNTGTMTISKTTIMRNASIGGSGGGIHNSGTLVIINSTIADNHQLTGGSGGGIANFGI